ncbi:MAG: M48 family metalloprotease [Deltaproteobacteria bacterium]|nr:M48 family metalloprotease [Deltaproteobacteria bacterium]MBW1994436.1 M48 family metalloprotease [Deltaproteobacteria bacterium]MBW2153489.1 M48 family metalloprotease [Deltaproteobacteria bacterium]
MRLFSRLLFFLATAYFTAIFFNPQPVAGITLKEEEELSREFLEIVKKKFNIIDDPLITGYVSNIGKKILKSLPPQPFSYRFYVIKEDVYNAFATPAGHIFMHSGLIEALDSEEELAGILAHETAHVVCRHISQKIDRSKKVSLATLAGMAAGTFLGAAGVGGAAAKAVTIGSIAAGQSVMLAYSREDETQADDLALEYLERSGYSGRGLLTGLQKIRSKQWFGTKQIPNYLMTHPASEDRIARIGSKLDRRKAKKQPAIRDPYAFKLVRNRLLALYGDEEIALQRFKILAENHPEDAMAQYGYGLILARTGNRKEAVQRVKRALEKRAFDPYILADLGRIYFLDGRYPEAVEILESVLSIKPQYAEALYYLAKIKMEQGDYKQAEIRLEQLVASNPNYNNAYYSLGEAYGKQGKMGEAHYNLGVFFFNLGNPKKAKFHLQRASTSLDDSEKLSKIKRILNRIEKKSQQQTNKEQGQLRSK